MRRQRYPLCENPRLFPSAHASWNHQFSLSSDFMWLVTACVSTCSNVILPMRKRKMYCWFIANVLRVHGLHWLIARPYSFNDFASFLWAMRAALKFPCVILLYLVRMVYFQFSLFKYFQHFLSSNSDEKKLYHPPIRLLVAHHVY